MTPDERSEGLSELWEALTAAKTGLVCSIKTGHDVWTCECFPCSGLRAIWTLELRDGLFCDRLAAWRTASGGEQK